MSNKATDVQDSARSLIQDSVLPVLKQSIRYQTEFADELLSAFHEFAQTYTHAREEENASLFFDALSDYTVKNYQLIEHRYKDNRPRRFHEILEEYSQVKKSFLESLPVVYEEVQLEQRFETQPADAWKIRFIKQWKRWFRRWKNLPNRIANFFRKLFRREPKPLQPWKYKIPLRNLSEHYYLEEYAEGLIPVFEKIYRELAITSQQAWQLCDRMLSNLHLSLQEQTYEDKGWIGALPSLDTESFEKKVAIIKAELHELEAEILEDQEQLLEKIHQRFQYDYERAGTAELPSSHFSSRKLQAKQQHTEKAYLNFGQGWRNTLFALHEDWRIDAEFSVLSHELLFQHFKVRDEAHHKIRQAVLPQIHTAKSVIQNALEAIEKSSEEDMEGTLNDQKQYIDLQLIRTILPATIAVLYRQALPALMENVRLKAKEKVEQLPERRGLVKTNEYNRVIKSSEIDFVSPRQIVSFESLPNLKNKIDESEEKVSQELAALQKQINEVGQVSYFNLDSALSVFEGEQESKAKAQSIAMEGLQRALKGVESITENLDHTFHHLDKDVRAAVQAFIQELTELKSNDYALELKLRVARAKALEQTRMLQQQALDYARNAVPYTLRYIRKNYGRAQRQVKDYRKQMGISEEVEVSTEISDFLTETEKSIQQLPYVYQRLFSIRPLEEAVFYEERGAETKMIQDAFQNWSKGRFASTAIIGEKGSGITTLLNFFLKQSNQRNIRRCEVIRANTFRQIHSEEDLLSYFSGFFPDQNFMSMEDVAYYLTSRTQPLILVFENLEHFYLRNVGGFKCLKVLFELISKTNKQVFWLCSCTLYAWNYLDKTVHISDYFEYEVQLQAFQNQQLREVILKRHRVSGYALVYEAAREDRFRKKFAKMSKDEQQLYLEKEYFNDLNKITSGNFSIAQLFWLRSARRVTEDTIYIGSLKDYDFSFVKSISLQHLLTFHLLVLHDGLTEEQFRRLTEYQIEAKPEAKQIGKNSLSLIQLMDDGFITKKEEVYIINPLLYRQVVNLLKAKNFLH